MNRSEAETFLSTHKQGVLATIRKDGRPQLSNVLFVYNGSEIIVSITETRAKYHNLVRDARVTLLALGDNFYQYLVADGTASFTHLPEAHEGLRNYYRAATGGEHPDWTEYDQAMRNDRRVLLTITIDDMYPLSDS